MLENLAICRKILPARILLQTKSVCRQQVIHQFFSCQNFGGYVFAYILPLQYLPHVALSLQTNKNN